MKVLGPWGGERLPWQVAQDTIRMIWDKGANDAYIEYQACHLTYTEEKEPDIIIMMMASDNHFREKFREMGFDQETSQQLNDTVVQIIRSNDRLREDIGYEMDKAFEKLNSPDDHIFKVYASEYAAHVDAIEDQLLKELLQSFHPTIKQQVEDWRKN